MLATAPVAPGTVPRPVYDNWGYDYWQQLPDGRVALGGGRDRFGDGEWGRPAEPDARIQAWLDRLLRERAGVEAPVTHRWAGVIAYTEDRLPVLEEVRPGRAGLRRVQRPRQRAGLRGGPCGGGDRARRAGPAARAPPAARDWHWPDGR